MQFKLSASDEAFSGACGTLLDISELAFDKRPIESIDAKCERINSLVCEIIMLVDLLLADHKVTVILPGEAA
jgi:hypothetical protein